MFRFGSGSQWSTSIKKNKKQKVIFFIVVYVSQQTRKLQTDRGLTDVWYDEMLCNEDANVNAANLFIWVYYIYFSWKSAYKCIATVNICMVNVANDTKMSYVLKGCWTTLVSLIELHFSFSFRSRLFVMSPNQGF